MRKAISIIMHILLIIPAVVGTAYMIDLYKFARRYHADNKDLYDFKDPSDRTMYLEDTLEAYYRDCAEDASTMFS